MKGGYIHVVGTATDIISYSGHRRCCCHRIEGRGQLTLFAFEKLLGRGVACHELPPAMRQSEQAYPNV
jgi:hypothetical protein